MQVKPVSELANPHGESSGRRPEAGSPAPHPGTRRSGRAMAPSVSRPAVEADMFRGPAEPQTYRPPPPQLDPLFSTPRHRSADTTAGFPLPPSHHGFPLLLRNGLLAS